MTYRERRARRAEQLRAWAESRERKAEAAYGSVRAIADNIPFGQPILVGHHSEAHARRDAARIDSGMRRTIEHSAKAEEMRSRAEHIEQAAERAIYSDDPDAIERLRARIADLEAERARIMAYNKSCRDAAKIGGRGDVSILGEDGQRTVMLCAQAGQLRAGGALPPYALSNLTGNIARQQVRLAALLGES